MTNNMTASPKRLLVALDGSRLAETVLTLVRTLAKALGSQVTLLHVLEYNPPETVHGEPHLTTFKDAEAYLARVAGFPLTGTNLPVTTHVHPNQERDVAASIAAHAAELDADLIVLAAHGRGGLRDWLVGRIPQQVTARAGRGVLIVPAPAERGYSIVRHIMLPVDPAGESTYALPLARQLAAACHAELILLTVIPTPGTMPGEAGVSGIFLPRATSALLDWAAGEARVKLEQLARPLEEAGLKIETVVRRGDPASEIAQAIAARDVDIAVMATHARAGLDGLLAGSVTPRVVAKAPCPLLLLPIKE